MHEKAPFPKELSAQLTEDLQAQMKARKQSPVTRNIRRISVAIWVLACHPAPFLKGVPVATGGGLWSFCFWWLFAFIYNYATFLEVALCVKIRRERMGRGKSEIRE
jgi:hypothetical protein